MFATIVIDLDPNLFQVGPFLVTWHGIFSVLGILAAARLGQLLLRGDGIAPERVYDMAVWMVIAGLVGARLLYAWENYQQFVGAWQKVLFVNEGGISQWGGIFGALLGGYLWCWRSRVDYRAVLDAAGPATALGFAIGRIGDIINGEHHAIGTSLPWRRVRERADAGRAGTRRRTPGRARRARRASRTTSRRRRPRSAPRPATAPGPPRRRARAPGAAPGAASRRAAETRRRHGRAAARRPRRRGCAAGPAARGRGPASATAPPGRPPTRTAGPRPAAAGPAPRSAPPPPGGAAPSRRVRAPESCRCPPGR